MVVVGSLLAALVLRTVVVASPIALVVMVTVMTPVMRILLKG